MPDTPNTIDSAMRSVMARFVVFGVLFGALFPAAGTVIAALMEEGVATAGALLRAQAAEPLLWIIDTTPLVLGLFSLAVGRRQMLLVRRQEAHRVETERSNRHLEEANEALRKEIARRRAAESRLRERMQAVSLISEISTRLLHLPASDVDRAIGDVLERLGLQFRADRATLLRLHRERGRFEATHAWSLEGVEDRDPPWESVPLDEVPWFLRNLEAGTTVRFHAPDDLPDGAAERDRLLPKSVASFVAVPVSRRGRLRGLLCLEAASPREPWPDGLAAVLRVAGDFVHGAQERCLAEQTLKLQSTALQAAANGIVITDRDGLVRWVNPGFTALTGFAADEVVGRSPRLLKSGVHEPSFYSEMWRTIRDGRVWRGEVTNRRKDGSFYQEEMTITPMVDGHGIVSHYIAIKQDITDRKRVEEAMEKARVAAVEASRLKSEFLANMSHEIRTPLNGIVGMTELALETALTDEQREYLQTCKLSAEVLMDIINDILDFSKIEAGKLELENIPFDLQHCVEHAVRPLSLRAHQKGIELITDVPEQVPARLRGDPGRLRQVLVNLLGNAVKFTREGEVVLRVSLQSRSEDLVRLLFEVEDTGIGIDPDKHSSIFDAFSQADGSTSRRYGGTGLGLTISRQLVGLMGGKIWVDSAPGKGSTFRFNVRLREAVPPGVEARPARPLAPGSRVLVVDDSATNRRILEETVRGWDLDCRGAASGDEALEALEEGLAAGAPYALAVLDGQMPRMDGFVLAGRIRQRLEFANLPLLMLTSAGSRGDGARCRELGINAYLTKPVATSDLRDAIDAVLGSEGPAESSDLVTRHTLRERQRRLRILLAEDNLVNRRVATRLLEKQGHEVVGVENGLRALEEVGSSRFDAVLMDVQMPGMDGLEATAAIRALERERGGHLPIIALTAHALKGDEQRCLDAGMDGYVSKPIDREELFATLHRLAGPASRHVPFRDTASG